MKDLALNIPGPGGGKIDGITPESTKLGDLISTGADAAMLIIGALLIIWMVWGALQYLFAGGDKESLAKGRSRITYAIVGFLIVAAAFAFKNYALDILQPLAVNLR